jgi:hypothetical protein
VRVVQLRPEEAARVVRACDVFATSAAERADALLPMTEATLRGDRSERPPMEVIVRIDAASLNGNAGGAGISADSAETSRRLLCECGVVPVIEDALDKALEGASRARRRPRARERERSRERERIRARLLVCALDTCASPPAFASG